MTDESSEIGAIRFLRQSGIINPLRLVRLINEAISFLKLDLTGFTVLTEAASGPYVVTPVIASLAGAERVLALTQESRFASAAQVIAQTEALKALSGVKGRIEIHSKRSLDLFAQADIITNLGFVRPIDSRAVAVMKPSAVIALMCEAWEVRPGDVDLDACQRRGIPVWGTNEDYPGLEVFAYSGWLCLKMLFDAGIEIHKSNILVVSSDKFGQVIQQTLSRSGVEVHLTDSLRDVAVERLAAADAVVVADYTRTETIIGHGGDLSSDDFARIAPGATIIQFAGQLDVEGLKKSGVIIYPGIDLSSHRMAKTLAELGPRPVVELHAAGLKVGEIAARNHRGTSLKQQGPQSLLQTVNTGSD